MADYEKVVFEQLGLHPLQLPNALLAPLQCHIQRKGRPFGRFALSDVFAGDFSGVAVFDPALIADLRRTLSSAYAIKGDLRGKGPFGSLTGAEAALEAGGAKRLVLSSMDANLQECDQGALHYALAGATLYETSPLQRGDICFIIVGVAALTKFTMQLESQSGAKLEASADLVGDMNAAIGVSAERRADGSLEITYPEPLPFAARVWQVRRRFFGDRLKLETPDGPVGLLGKGPPTPSSGKPIDLFSD